METVRSVDEGRLESHLARAGALLRADELDGARREVEQALALRPDDVRARNLLGLLAFRGGHFDEAQKVFSELVARAPQDPGLHLNLGLVELGLGKPGDAAQHLRRVVEREPRNARAHAYLGLALLRAGDLPHARRAFLDAGQDDLAHQIEERLARSVVESERSIAEVRRIADAGLRAVDAEETPFATVDTAAETRAPATPGAWQVHTPGAPLPSPDAAEGSTTAALPQAPLAPPELLADYAARTRVEPRTGETFAVGAGGVLVIRVEGRVATRTAGAIASTGTLAFQSLERRVRGRLTGEPFGEGAAAVTYAAGEGVILVAARGSSFVPVALRGEALYVREDLVYAFEETLVYENGRIPGSGGASFPVVQLRGTGACVLRLARPPVATRVAPGQPMYVDGDALVGWAGHIVPRQLAGPDGTPAPYLECSGEGTLFLDGGMVA